MFGHETLQDLRNLYRQDFIDYESFLGVASSISSKKTISSTKIAISNYDSLRALQDTLKSSLHSRIDSAELMGLASNQIGIPAHAIYFEYVYKGHLKEILLTDPEIVASKTQKDKHKLFLKLIKCPNSPTPYHIGIFNQNVVIRSSNSKDFSLSINDSLDPTGNLSANLQRVVWADKGFIPGDYAEIPMNYMNVCNTLDKSEKLKDAFNCWVRKEEIELILEKYKVVDAMGQHRSGVGYLRTNLLKLLTENINRNWIKVPSINMFKKDYNISLN